MRETGAVLMLATAAALAGCTGPEEEGNRNLRVPTLVVDDTPDNLTTLYVHAAFTNERVYDGMRLALDNETVAEANHTFALVHKTNRSQFFLDVDVAEGLDRFRYQARLQVDAPEGILGVSVWDPRDGTLAEAANVSLPYKKVVPSYEPPAVEE